MIGDGRLLARNLAVIQGAGEAVFGGQGDSGGGVHLGEDRQEVASQP